MRQDGEADVLLARCNGKFFVNNKYFHCNDDGKFQGSSGFRVNKRGKEQQRKSKAQQEWKLLS